MKLAIQLSGLPESFNTTFKFLQQQLFNQLSSYDLYYVTWNTIDIDILNKFNPTKYYLVDKKKFLELKRVQSDLKLCKEKSYKSWYYIKYYSTYIQFHQRYVCNRLRINSGISYDIVMVVRPDTIFIQPFKQDWLPNMKDSLNIPTGADCGIGYTDMLAVGRPDLITVYCNTYLKLKKLLNSEGCKFYHPEYLLKLNLTRHNIKPYRFSFPINLRAFRLNY